MLNGVGFFFFELKEKPFIDIIIPGTTDGFLTKG